MNINFHHFHTYILLFIFLIFSTALLGQKPRLESPYLVSWKVDGPILGVAVGGYLAGLRNITGVDDASEAQVLGLDKNDLKWGINRWVTRQHSEVADGFSDGLLFSSYAAGITLFAASDKIRNNLVPPLVVFAESYLFVRAAAFWTKSSVKRFRPYAYDSELDIEIRKKDSARTSFFSGHASATSVVFFTTAKMFADYYPDAKAKPYVWAGAATIPLLTSYLRMEAGRHFIGDVATGYLVGAAFGILVPHFHKKAKEKSMEKPNGTTMRFYPTESGVGFSMVF